MGLRSSLGSSDCGGNPVTRPAPVCGGNQGLLDQLLGSAYDMVRHVAQNIEHVKHVSAHLDRVYRLSASVAEIDVLYTKIDILEELHSHLDDLTSLIAGLATADQGARADSAVQPGDLAAVAFSGAYADLSGRPVFGSAAFTAADAYATAAQGAKADTAVQPDALALTLAATLNPVAPAPVANTILVAKADGSAREAKTFAEIRGLLLEKHVFEADASGGSDVAAALVSACAAKKYIRVPRGDYLLGSDVTIPADCVIEFDRGARFVIGTNVRVIWNGGLVAGPYQQIFAGHLVQSGYTSNSLTPYQLALRGTPKIAYASPFWFGAVADNLTDDYNALVAALFFGKVCYLPGVDVAGGKAYAITTSLPLRQSGQLVCGDGYTSLVRLVSFSPTGVGQLLGIAGLLPTVSGGLPAAYVDDVVIRDLHFDTNNGKNDNGIGGSLCRNVRVAGCFFSNIGRKAVTFQYHVHNHVVENCIVYSAAMEAGGTSSVVTVEGENTGMSYANGVAGYDWQGGDNTGHKLRNIHVYESGYSGVTLSNSRRCTVESVTIDKLGAAGRPFIISGASIGNVIRSFKVKKSTRGFLNSASANTTSTRFYDCWIEDCSGDNMLYSEGPGTEFRYCGGVQTDDRTAWSIKGADCAILECRVDMPAITAATQAVALFATAARFKMKNCYVDSQNAQRGFGGSTAPDVEIANNTFTGGVTDGILVAGANAHVHGNVIGGNASGRVRVSSGTVGASVHDNRLTGGASATIDWSTTADLWASGIKANNPGDTSVYHCTRFGGRFDGIMSGSPVGAITANVGSTMRDATGGKLYIKATATDTTGWVVVGTQT